MRRRSNRNFSTPPGALPILPSPNILTPKAEASSIALQARLRWAASNCAASRCRTRRRPAQIPPRPFCSIACMATRGMRVTARVQKRPLRRLPLSRRNSGFTPRATDLPRYSMTAARSRLSSPGAAMIRSPPRSKGLQIPSTDSAKLFFESRPSVWRRQRPLRPLSPKHFRTFAQTLRKR